MFCPSCGKENADQAKFCNGCGNAMSEQEKIEERKCPNCGKEYEEGSKYCIFCGSVIPDPMWKGVCPKCKTVNSADSRFCSKCGHDLRSSKTPSGPAKEEPPTEPSSETKEIRILKTLRSFATSSLFKMAIVFFAASAIFSFIGTCDFLANIEEWFSKLFGYAGYYLYEEYYSSTWVTLMLLVDFSIPALVATGLYLCMQDAQSSGNTMNSRGIKLIRLGMRVRFGLMVVMALFLLFGLVILSAALQDYDISFGPVVLLALPVFAVGFYYLVQILKSLESAITAAEIQTIYELPTTFMGVMCFISAGANVLMVLFGFSSLNAYYIISYIAGGLASAQFGSLIFQYKGAMEPILYAPEYSPHEPERSGNPIKEKPGVPYWCGTCGQDGPYLGACPSCGSSLKKYPSKSSE